jgi:hypothetical protein
MADDFLTTYAPLANDIATRTNIDPSVVLGIIDTETGHGQHVSGNNIFGISPVVGGRQVVAGYPDVQTASNAFINLMQTPRYAGVAAAPDPTSQAVALVKSGYNTANPAYASIVANKALQFGKQLGYQGDGQGSGGTTIAVTSSQPAPDYTGAPTAAPAPDYNTPAPAAAPAPQAQPPAGSAKDRVLADPALNPGGGSTAAPAQGQTAKDRVLADPALQTDGGTSTAATTQSAPAPAVPATSAGTVDEYGNVQTPLPAPPPAPSLDDVRGAIQRGDINALKYLAPGPDAGPIESAARKAAMLGVHTLATAAQIPVSALMAGVAGPEAGATWNPATGTFGATPEALAALGLVAGLGGRDIQFSGANPLQFVPPTGTFDRGPPIPADAAANLLNPDAAARIRAAQGEPVPVAQPTVSTPFNAPPPSATAPNLPPVPDGMVRLYHGGSDPTSGGARWVTPDYAYARDYRPGQPVSYVDVPRDNPAVQAAVASHPDEPLRIASFNAPEDIAKRLQPVPTPQETPAASSSPTGVPVTPPAGAAVPQPVGAQATPAYEAIHTPAEEAAYRATAEGQKLLEPQKIGEPDLNQYIPGETVNNAEREQTVKAARELKELGIRVPEASDLDKAAAESNNTARTIYLDNTTKGPVEIHNETVARQADIAADKAKVFAPENITGPVNLQPVIDHMESVLDQPFNRQNTALQQAYRPWLERMKAFPDATIDNPEEAWGLRYDIDQQTDKFAQRDNPNMHRVAHQLGDAADAVDRQIEAVAPGYADMLARYKEHSRAIDEMEVLQGAKDKFRGPGQKLTYNDFQRYMKNVVDSRMTPSTDLNAFKAISPENMQRLWNIRDSLRRTASAQELAKAAGSDTMPNIIDALRGIGKMGGTAALHAYVGAHLGPGGNLALQSLGAMGRALSSRRMIRRATTQMNRLLRPDEPLRVPPGQENPLSGTPAP